jgi:hypothetical protein
MPSPPQSDSELAARAELAYSSAVAEKLITGHRLGNCTTAEALQRFLVKAGTVYLVQKRDAMEHQAPSRLRTELGFIQQLADKLSERLQRIPVHVHDFQHSRLMQKMPFGGLGPVPVESISDVKAKYEPGSPEYELARRLGGVCSEKNISAVQGILVSAQAAMIALTDKDFGGRLPNLALNRWADNVRNFWVKGMHLPFAHSVVGSDATSAPANFCIDAMAALDSEPTKAEIMTAVRYARDAAIAWEKMVTLPQTGTTPDQ